MPFRRRHISLGRTVSRANAAVARDHEVVVTHGNGPQVGLLMERTASATFARWAAASARSPRRNRDVFAEGDHDTRARHDVGLGSHPKPAFHGSQDVPTSVPRWRPRAIRAIPEAGAGEVRRTARQAEGRAATGIGRPAAADLGTPPGASGR